MIKKTGLFIFLGMLAFASAYYSLPVVEAVFKATEQKLPIFSVETEEKVLALTFNAAWGAEDTDILLEILDENEVQATFFLSGQWAEQFPEDVQKLLNAGHELGNHGNSHAHVGEMDLEGNKKEIMDAHSKIKDVTGLDVNLYRPAYGEYNETVVSAAEECGYFTVQWSVDSIDWRGDGVETEINRVLQHKNLGNGGILLYHNGAKYTPEALPVVLKGLKEQGYSFVLLSDLLYPDNFYLDNDGRQWKEEVQ